MFHWKKSDFVDKISHFQRQQNHNLYFQGYRKNCQLYQCRFEPYIFLPTLDIYSFKWKYSNVTVFHVCLLPILWWNVSTLISVRNVSIYIYFDNLTPFKASGIQYFMLWYKHGSQYAHIRKNMTGNHFSCSVRTPLLTPRIIAWNIQYFCNE